MGKKALQIENFQDPLNDHKYESILSSTREVRNLEIEWGRFDQLQIMDILEKFGASIKNLKLVGPETSFEDFYDMMRIACNVEKLELSVPIIVDSNSPTPPQIDFSKDLKQLKSVIFNKFESLKAFEGLPPNVHKNIITVEVGVVDLYADPVEGYDKAADVDRNKKILKKFRPIDELGAIIGLNVSVPADFFDDLGVKRLKIAFQDVEQDVEALQKIISMQDQLIELCLDYVPPCPVTLPDDPSRTLLRCLVDFKMLEKLHVTFTPANHALYQALAGLQLESVRELKFNIPADADREDLRKISYNFKNLRKLTIVNDQSLDVALSILSSFRQVESLTLTTFELPRCEYTPGQHTQDYRNVLRLVEHMNFENRNLKMLDFGNDIASDGEFISKMIKSYPNLERLTLRQPLQSLLPMVRQLRSILKHWKKLTHLVLLRGRTLENEDLDLLADYGPNLQLVAIASIPSFSNQRIRDELKEKFSIVRLQKGKRQKNNLLVAKSHLVLNEFDETYGKSRDWSPINDFSF